jgi:hypothetical protein
MTIANAAIAFKGDRALHQSTSRDWHHDKEASPGKHRHRVKTHLTNGNARLKKATILARWDSGWL